MSEIEFTVRCRMDGRWFEAFCSMLKYMEATGRQGEAREIGLFSDGKGGFRPVFQIEGAEHGKYVPPVPSTYSLTRAVFSAGMDREALAALIEGGVLKGESLDKAMQLRRNGWENKDFD
ncbi:MAG: hypothetical protein J6Y62_04535 [Clostridia bacterium]|nr:hypothetical protein [Clostridia bacterium]